MRLPVPVAGKVVARSVVVLARYADDGLAVSSGGIAFNDLHVPYCGIAQEAGALLGEVKGEAGGGFFLRGDGAADGGLGARRGQRLGGWNRQGRLGRRSLPSRGVGGGVCTW